MAGPEEQGRRGAGRGGQRGHGGRGADDGGKSAQMQAEAGEQGQTDVEEQYHSHHIGEEIRHDERRHGQQSQRGKGAEPLKDRLEQAAEPGTDAGGLGGEGGGHDAHHAGEQNGRERERLAGRLEVQHRLAVHRDQAQRAHGQNGGDDHADLGPEGELSRQDGLADLRQQDRGDGQQEYRSGDLPFFAQPFRLQRGGVKGQKRAGVGPPDHHGDHHGEEHDNGKGDAHAEPLGIGHGDAQLSLDHADEDEHRGVGDGGGDGDDHIAPQDADEHTGVEGIPLLHADLLGQCGGKADVNDRQRQVVHKHADHEVGEEEQPQKYQRPPPGDPAGDKPACGPVNEAGLLQGVVQDGEHDHGDDREVTHGTRPHLGGRHGAGEDQQAEKQQGAPAGVDRQPQVQGGNGDGQHPDAQVGEPVDGVQAEADQKPQDQGDSDVETGLVFAHWGSSSLKKGAEKQGTRLGVPVSVFPALIGYCGVDSVERHGAQPQTSWAISFTSASFFHWSSSVTRLPSSVEAKPHWGLRAS